MRFVRFHCIVAATIALLFGAVVAHALAPLGEFDLTLDGVPFTVTEKVHGEYEFPYAIQGGSETYYIRNEETIAAVRDQFLGAMQRNEPITVKAHVLMVFEDLLVIDQIYSLSPGLMEAG